MDERYPDSPQPHMQVNSAELSWTQQKRGQRQETQGAKHLFLQILGKGSVMWLQELPHTRRNVPPPQLLVP